MKHRVSLLIILVVGAILRFYNLDWSKGIVWHPDERNMAVAVEQFRLPERLRDLPTCLSRPLPTTNYPLPTTHYPLPTGSCNFNPKFFAYGGFPLYLSFVTGILSKSVGTLTLIKNLNFLEATIFLRTVSASASVLSLIFVYLIGKSLFSPGLGVFATALTAFIPGLIQAAHFGTTESLMSFLILAVTHFSLRYLSQGRKTDFLALAASLGLLLGTKVSGAVIIPIPLLAILLRWLKTTHDPLWLRPLLLFNLVSSFSLIAAGVFFLSSPYNFLDVSGFRGSMNYEGPVALGTLPVFYTRQFVHTDPVIFHFEKILPFALGPFLTIAGVFGLIFLLIESFRKRRSDFLIASLSFLFFFVPNLFLFAKWTRFISPVFPFFSLFSVSLLYRLTEKRGTTLLLGLTAFTVTALHGLAFFSIYTQTDVRYAASRWIYQNIKSQSVVLSETANVSDIPILPGNRAPEGYELHPISFNFYDLDADQTIQKQLVENLAAADYIFVPSRRIFKNHLRLKEKYPILSRYYESLFNGELGLAKVAQFTGFPSLSIMNYQFSINDEDAEETYTVFDHPVVRIYKKEKKLSDEKYRQLLGTSQ